MDMAGTAGLTSGLLPLITLTLQSSVALYNTIMSLIGSCSHGEADTVDLARNSGRYDDSGRPGEELGD